MQSAKLTSTQWRGDIGRFPAGGRFNKRTKTNTVCAVTGLLRGEDGGTLDTSSCRKEAELWKKANRSHGRVSLTPPWTRDLTLRLLPITSARHLAHIPRTRSIVWGCLGGVQGSSEGGGVLFMEGSKEWKSPCSQANYKKSIDAGWSVQPQSTGRENILLQHKGYKKTAVLPNMKLEKFLLCDVFWWGIKKVHSKWEITNE